MRWIQYALRWMRALWRLFTSGECRKYGRRKQTTPHQFHTIRRPKPAWVTRELIQLKVLLPDSGCRSLAQLFNRRFAGRSMTVGKTFANTIIRRHQYDIQIARRKIKQLRPRPVPLNRVWGVDLTGKTDEQSRQHSLLGVLEHHSRACLTLTALRDKASITVLRHLLDAIERFGRPAILRTDNEAVFTSRLFRLSLWLLGIQHQRSDLGCPWQNGRIERFFGTLKQKLDQWAVDNREQLNLALAQFRFWNNHVRLHQNLGGRTPAEAWNGIDISTRPVRKEYYFEAWDGVLKDVYLML